MEGEEEGLGFLSVNELKGEVKRLACILARGEECEIKVYDRIIAAVQKLKKLRLNKTSESSNPKDQKCKGPLESLAVPECFLCPISSELMTDPVMVATGQTYDRPYIQTWFDAEHRTCPKTQQLLPHLHLTPNYLVRSMIEQWCEVHGVEYPTRATTSGTGDTSTGIMPHEVKYLNMLVDRLSSQFLSQQREAARELRALTKRKHSHRVFLGGEPRAIALLIGLLSSNDAETQEHTVTALFNLSIYEPNKVVISHEKGIEPIVQVLRTGLTTTARENAAATLFSLSAIDENKVKIGAVDGAVSALVELLEQAKSKDAASALFNLCIRQENRTAAVRAGVVSVLKRLVRNGMRDESLAILALLSSNLGGAMDLVKDAAEWLEYLMTGVLKDTSASTHTKENAVVIITAMCAQDPCVIKELSCNTAYVQALVALSVAGASSRSRRKANTLIERINKQSRHATF